MPQNLINGKQVGWRKAKTSSFFKTQLHIPRSESSRSHISTVQCIHRAWLMCVLIFMSYQICKYEFSEKTCIIRSKPGMCYQDNVESTSVCQIIKSLKLFLVLYKINSFLLLIPQFYVYLETS